ncbi:MAG: efflux RND transporter periplasmic adaptor subunit [Candidatus Delongbacteria bacterium]|jgi:HlyD family secretion protein|nr:efflux RND transporter periplasmic adaptor subunit [Candidatus Delongbacteria bacterium]
MKWFKRKYLLGLIILLVVVGVSLLYSKMQTGESDFIVSTVKVSKGSISNTITATGRLQATNTVIVGTQVSGVIEKLYADFNSDVKKGQLIAELDKSILQSNLENIEADIEKTKANYDYQKSRYEQNKELFEQGFLAQSDYDLVIFNYKTSKADVKSANANLTKAQKNLNYASIYSPIDGVVLNRAVEEGQTVAASMSTPELFTITNDLSTMQVEASIDEADIGLLMLDQRVEFTVDAFPDMEFEGKVSEIRLQPNESSNVITYTTIISVNNPDYKLKPGMTASITIYIEEANDVLLISEKATSFTPERHIMDAYMSSLNEKFERSEKDNSDDTKQRSERPLENMQELDDSHKVVWIKDGDQIRPSVIETGIGDGANIEVVSGLEEGSLLITSMESGSNSEIAEGNSGDDEQKSPFVQEGQSRGAGRGRGEGGPPR